MFAVLKTGGKQYRVQSGDILRVEKLAADAGDAVQFNDILMIGSKIGTPLVDGAAVQAEVIDQIKGDKTINFVKRRRKHGSQRTRGHRQQLTLLRVTDLLEQGGGDSGVKAAVGAGTAGGSAAAGASAAASAGPAAAKADDDGAPGARPGNLLTEARDGTPDDLKKISGVGPKLEGLLNQNGVFHFDQIAAWNADEIAYMDDQLSFRGRIARDGWIDQAAKLAADKE